MSDLPVYVLEREFAATPARLWACWSEQDLLKQWFGPGVETIIHELTVSVGGLWLTEMVTPRGSMYQRAEYTEVEPQKKIVWLHSTTDENWQPMDNPMMPDWPKQLLSTLTFAPSPKGCKMRFEWVPFEASEAENACFANMLAGLDQGWSKGMEILEELL